MQHCQENAHDQEWRFGHSGNPQPKTRERMPADSHDVPDPATAARAMRQHWLLGTGPIKHLVYQLEQHGILTVFFSMKEDAALDEKSRIDAFSTIALPRPMIVLTPDKANDVMRHRFSAAT